MQHEVVKQHHDAGHGARIAQPARDVDARALTHAHISLRPHLQCICGRGRWGCVEPGQKCICKTGTIQLASPKSSPSYYIFWVPCGLRPGSIGGGHSSGSNGLGVLHAALRRFLSADAVAKMTMVFMTVA